MPLNFGGRKRSGAFDTVWPSARTAGKARKSQSYEGPTKIEFLFFAAQPCSRPLAAPLSSPWRPMMAVAAVVPETMGGGGRDVEGAGIADPSGRACGHDSGHADDARAALGAPASRMLTMTMHARTCPGRPCPSLLATRRERCGRRGRSGPWQGQRDPPPSRPAIAETFAANAGCAPTVASARIHGKSTKADSTLRTSRGPPPQY